MAYCTSASQDSLAKKENKGSNQFYYTKKENC